MAEKKAWVWDHVGGHAPGTADALAYRLEEAIRSALPISIAPEIEVRNDPRVPLGTVRILIAVGASPTPPARRVTPYLGATTEVLVYDPALNPGGELAAAIEAGEQAEADACDRQNAHKNAIADGVPCPPDCFWCEQKGHR